MIPSDLSIRSPTPVSDGGGSSDSDFDENVHYSFLESYYLAMHSKSKIPNQKMYSAFTDLYKFILLHPDSYLAFESLAWKEFKIFTEDYLQIRKAIWKESNPALTALVVVLNQILKLFPEFSKYPALRTVAKEHQFSSYLQDYHWAIRSPRKETINKTYQKIQRFVSCCPEFSSRLPKKPYILNNIFLPGNHNTKSRMQ